MRNASGHRGENERQLKKKANSKSYDISSMKRATRKFHIVVVQNNGQEMYKKVCYTCKGFFFFWLIRPIDFLFFSLLSLFSITRFYFNRVILLGP